MYVRLAFAVAAHLESEILIIYEVLAVGDKGFQEKCKKRIHEIKEAGATILFVSHNPEEIKEVCDRGICLDKGRISYDGDAQGAVKQYLKLFN